VRNGVRDLPGFFESAARFADAVVALDDGSTDETRAILERERQVAKLLTNPVRPDYQHWNDAANRNLLLRAAAELAPDWIISVDADERIDEGDATALRAFLESDALPGVAYGFRCYSMVRDLAHVLPRPIWVYRMFAFVPGQGFPNQELHFAPIPTAIPRQAFLRTTFRIQHLGGMSKERRLARYEKYRQADPECRYWPDYTGLLKEPDEQEVIPWRARDPRWPAFYTSELDDDLDAAGGISGNLENAIEMSIVVLDHGPVDGVRRALMSALDSAASKRIELLLVTRENARSPVPERVQLVAAGTGASTGAMRNAGIRAARGRYISFLDSDVCLAPGAVERLIAGYQSGFALVTGIVTNRGEGTSRSAVYASRFNALRKGRPEGMVERPMPWASYARSLLIEDGGFLEMLPGGEEVELGRRLASLGHLTLRLGSPILEFHGDSVATSRRGIKWAFDRGRGRARSLTEAYGDRGEMIDRAYLKRQIYQDLLGRLRRLKPVDGEHRGKQSSDTSTRRFRQAIEIAQWVGQWLEIARPARDKALVLFGRPGGVALAVLTRGVQEPSISLIRFDLRAPALRIAHLPPCLRIPAADGSLITLQHAFDLGRSKGLDRFTIHDAVGRPFQIRIDDLIWIDGTTPVGHRIETAMLKLGAGKETQNVAGGTDFRLIAEVLLATRRRAPVRTTFSARAVALALLRLRRLRSDRVLVVAPFGPDEILTAEGVEMVRSFLAVDEIQRPMTRRDALRLVEWA
jgi:glycosyltransferase involved in cell wall biosynthesis